MKVTGQLHTLAALPTGNDPSTQWMEGGVDPRIGLDAMAKIKDPFPYPARNQTDLS